MNKQECIQQCSFENGVITLPDTQLDRNVYLEVKKTLTAIGAKWKGDKTQGFVLSEDKAELFERIKDDPDYNYRKDTKFFETPPAICNLIRDEILHCNTLQYLKILEPSAGRGALLNVIHKIDPVVQIQYCELDSYNQKALKNIDARNINFICADFMELNKDMLFDLIVANPPFDRGTAQKHLLKMIGHLKDGYGTLICVMPAGWNQGRWTEKFKFLDTGNYCVYEINCPEKAFEHTNISTVIVVIQSLC